MSFSAALSMPACISRDSVEDETPEGVEIRFFFSVPAFLSSYSFIGERAVQRGQGQSISLAYIIVEVIQDQI
jgi:hypothetical protein